MVSRIYVEKKPGFDVEAQQLAHELRSILGITSLEGLRLVNRYDVEGIPQELFDQCVPTVFSEPQVDVASAELPQADGAQVFAVEFLPGQFDQRAASASECIQLISQGERPEVRSAKVYLLSGPLSDQDVQAIKHYVINPIEAREASLEQRDTLAMAQPQPEPVEVLEGFLDLDAAGLAQFIADRELAMDEADLAFCQQYFQSEGRCPTITEIKMIDTYWSDHCRHTTFGTEMTDVAIDDPRVQAAFDQYMDMRNELGRQAKPVCLMDMGTIGAKWLKSKGVLTGLDESEEINACTVKCKVDVDGEEQDWLYLFKNETHNHPTEIEPFGGAATCLGGAIRDPLSGRSYVYQAMRVTGAANPLAPVSETLPGKLPQRKLVTTAAAGYSSYGNQIGLATGQVNELYHPGYVAKRMEIGAVVAATPADHVRRETPEPRATWWCCWAAAPAVTASAAPRAAPRSTTWSRWSIAAPRCRRATPPEERKIQRLFRRGEATPPHQALQRLRCGRRVRCHRRAGRRPAHQPEQGAEEVRGPGRHRAGHLRVAGAHGRALSPLLTWTSSCAMRARRTLRPPWSPTVTDDARVRVMWNDNAIIDLSREFLASNGAPKQQAVHVGQAGAYERTWEGDTLAERMNALVTDLNVCSNKGLSERFDSTIGAATVLMPFGGKNQLTPAQAMVAKLPVGGETTTCSGMAWGFNPYLIRGRPVHRLVRCRGRIGRAPGGGRLQAPGYAYLTFQEYFEKPARRARSAGASPRLPCWARSWRRSTWVSAPSAARTPCPAASSSSTCRPRSCPSPRRWARSAA